MKQAALAAGVFSLALGWAFTARSADENAAVAPAGSAKAAAHLPSAEAFQAATQVLFAETCSQCHNSVDADGGLDMADFATVGSLVSRREGWDQILSKLRTNEMPPSGIKRLEPQIDALVQFLEAELARVDENAAPDPGRVTARRLNRAEYTNTIRDLLALEFRADKAFPVDDSGDGFDNIGDVLSVSPILMEKYLAAAESIAARALATEPLPSPIQIDYSLKFGNLRRLERSLVEATHHVDFDARYELVVGLPGQRPEGSKPVTLAVWVDGKLVHSARVETVVQTLASVDAYSEERVRVDLPEGDHTVRLGFIRDDFVATLPEASLESKKLNKWIGALSVVGPFASKQVKPSRKRVLTCDPQSGPACVDKILTGLAQRAYRRPVTREEVSELRRFVQLATADGGSLEQGIALALSAMLVSPHFLFHVERDGLPSEPGKVQRVSDLELASRLSYFIWSSMPDDELLSEAIRGRLRQPAVVDAQVKRMLRDPKASALAENFAGQWLEIRNLDAIRPDPDVFPTWGPELKDAMRKETELFFGAMLKNDRPFGELIDARYTFLNETLARHYGVDGVKGPEFRRVTLGSAERGGILGHASVLAVSSYPTRTSVVLRGKYVLSNLLGAAPPPPPPDVPALDEKAVASSASLRQQMEEHRQNAVCSSCHSRMDPLGFGLENYDAIGRYRTVDGALPIDASGTLPSGESFQSPAELRRVLSGMLPDVARCLTEKMLTYALGRGLEPYDKPTVRAIAGRLTASRGGLQSLVHEISRSLPFQSRRTEGLAASDAKR
jgi:mono/diheme cytochrome c family protein